jgi:hypothetical protein
MLLPVMDGGFPSAKDGGSLPFNSRSGMRKIENVAATVITEIQNRLGIHSRETRLPVPGMLVIDFLVTAKGG